MDLKIKHTVRFITPSILPYLILLYISLATSQDVISDDFSSPTLNTSLWEKINPLGDATIEITQNKQLAISVPAGVNHDADVGGNTTARVMQSVNVSDFQVEVKFQMNLTGVSPVSQDQGILVEESSTRFLRFDVYYDGSLKAFCAFINDDTSTIHYNEQIFVSTPIWLRVSRAGDSLTFQYASDGQTWNDIVTFKQVITVNKIGPYVGNYSGYWFNGQSAPMHTVLVDYFFNTYSPISPEDGGYIDTSKPVLSNIDHTPSAATAAITWITDEYASSKVIYGRTPSYGNEVGDPILKKNHRIVLSGLTPNKLYHYKAISQDTENPEERGPDKIFTTLSDNTGPVINVWHGLFQRVGHLGDAQDDFNILGNVSDSSGVYYLEYSLNGAPPESLTIGNQPDGFGDGRRLAATGDFNADIPINIMNSGANNVVLTAIDSAGNISTQTVNIELETGYSPFQSIDWVTVSDPQDKGQYVDGQWGLDGYSLRILRPGYDRIFLIGERTWQDYEIECPFIVNGIGDFDPEVFNPAFGFLMRFTGHIVGGHRNFPEAQPKWGYQPFGSIGWLVWTETTTEEFQMQFYRGDDDDWNDHGKYNISHGDNYWMKMRCETLPDAPSGDGVTRYSFKVWKDGEAEPPGWSWQETQISEFALRQGGVGLITHHIDVTFGDVSITSLINNPPVITSSTLPPATEDQFYQYQIEAYDVDSDDILTYRLTVRPTWLNINSNTGVITGTPSEVHIGDTNLTVEVEDNHGALDSKNLSLSVLKGNDPPVLNALLPTLYLNEDDSLEYLISNWYPYVDDPDDPDETLIYMVSEGKHVIVAEKSSLFLFRGAMDWYGLDTLELRVSDGEFSDSATFVVQIYSINDAPILVNLPDTITFENTGSYSLFMDEYAEDKETTDAELNWEFSVSDDQLKYQFNEGTHYLTLTAFGFEGIVTLSCTVTDDSLASASDQISVKVTVPVGIESPENRIPVEYSLAQNFPNPFNPITNIRFGLPTSGEVRIEIYDIVGEKVVTLWEGHKSAGFHEAIFDGKSLSSGIYFYRIQTEKYIATKRMVLMK